MHMFPVLTYKHPGDNISVPGYLFFTDRTDPFVPAVRGITVGTAENMGQLIGLSRENSRTDPLAPFQNRLTEGTGPFALGRSGGSTGNPGSRNFDTAAAVPASSGKSPGPDQQKQQNNNQYRDTDQQRKLGK